MPASVLFCSDPLNLRRVDAHFEPQATAVQATGATVALIDHDALLRGEAAQAVRRVPLDLGPAWYRGWMIPSVIYAQLAEALANRGCLMLTGPAEYHRAHELPGWYSIFSAVTPKTVWTHRPAGSVPAPAELAELAAPLGGGAAIVKDFVKSRKHEWADACYVSEVSNPAHLHTVVANFVQRQGEDLAGGVVIRQFEEFESTGPRAGEARVWWLDGEPILLGPHPDTPAVAPQVDLSLVAPLVQGLGCRFITTDLAWRTDGQCRVVEVGDGQVSDLPASVNPAVLAAALTACG